MGIFGKSNKQSKQNSGATIISFGTTVKGGLNTEGSVFIDGKFEGIIVSTGHVNIGISGVIIGEIRAKNLTVSGIVDGVCDVEHINILSSGKIIGKIEYTELVIESNGIFDGIGKKKEPFTTEQYDSLEFSSIKSIK